MACTCTAHATVDRDPPEVSSTQSPGKAAIREVESVQAEIAVVGDLQKNEEHYQNDGTSGLAHCIDSQHSEAHPQDVPLRNLHRTPT